MATMSYETALTCIASSPLAAFKRSCQPHSPPAKRACVVKSEDSQAATVSMPGNRILSLLATALTMERNKIAQKTPSTPAVPPPLCLPPPVEKISAARVAVAPKRKSRKVRMCPHNRQKYRCKDCGGNSMCVHKRRRYNCVDCGGAGICEHKRRRSVCKDCGGSSVCIHKRRRSTCKECKGSNICEHQRVKSTCKECGGGSICPHNRRLYRCKECNTKAKYIGRSTKAT